MRKNIIQSKTEPNKNDIWISEEGLKKYGKNGWEPLGGGSNNSGGSNSGGSGPVIIEYPVEATDPIAITDEQIEAFKNSNVKIKFVDASEGLVLICIPYAYSIIGDSGIILIRMSDGTTISDVTFIVDITNKTIFWQQ